VLSTPYLDEAERCTRVALMNEGRIMRIDAPVNLKRKCARRCWEIVCDRVRDGFRLLKTRPEAWEVQAFGDRLHVIVARADRDADRVRETLTGAGIRIEEHPRHRAVAGKFFISLLTHKEQRKDVA